MFLLVPLLGTVIATIAHELGHFAIAALLRLGPCLVNIGVGPPLIRVRIGPTTFVLRLVPASGIVVCVPPSCSRLRSIAFVLGGVFGNLTGFVLLDGLAALSSAAHSTAYVPPQWFLIGLALFELPVAVIALIPHRAKIGHRRIASDGLQLFNLLFRRTPSALPVLHKYVLRDYARTGQPIPPPSPAFPDIAYQFLRTDRITDPWVHRDFTAASAELLARNDLPPAERSALITVVLATDIYAGTTFQTPQTLDALSQEALHLCPTPVNGVLRAAILLAIGRGAEAKPMLLALADQTMDLDDTALCQALLARTENDLAAKQAWLSQAIENATRAKLPTPAETFTAIASRTKLLA